MSSGALPPASAQLSKYHVSHRRGLSFQRASVADKRCRILAGVAIVENARDETARIEAVAPGDIERREKELLVLAKEWMAKLPFKHADVLLIDQIGKDISGTGLDTNVVGRKFDDHKAVEGEYPKVKVIALRGLTEATHGNAVGLGIAEFCRSQLLRETDLHATRLNAITASHLAAAMLPLDYETDREMLDASFSSIGLVEPPNAKLLWIKNTLALEELDCSAAYLAEARERQDLEILTPPHELPLDTAGNLPATCALDDLLAGDSLQSNPAFRAMVAKSRASPRKPFGR
jgi:hypothetical protein